jgi:2-dehydropantoate 2-reductase
VLYGVWSYQKQLTKAGFGIPTNPSDVQINPYLATTINLVAFAGTLIGFTVEHRSYSCQFLWLDSPAYAINLGEVGGGLSPRAEQLATMFKAAGVNGEAVADLRKIRWEKLVWNIPFNGLCALTNQTPGKLLDHPPMRRLVMEIMAEVITGGNAQGLSKPIPQNSYIKETLARTEKNTGDYRPSMMIDRLERRPLELEAIYQIPLQHAAKRGIKMARVEMLHALLDLGEQICN